MSSKQYTTEFVIKGDSTSGVKATRELQQANADMTREMQRAQRQSEEMTASFESVSAHAQRLATVSAATTAAMGAMAVAQTHNVAEQAALARSVGVTVQTLQQWEFAAQSVNLGAGKMGDIFKDTSEKIGDFVATGGGEAADLFERLNLDIDTLMGMRPDQQLLAIGEALDGVATQGEKIFFMESLANDASRLLPLLENNAAALRDQISLADQLGVALPQSDIDSIEQAAQKLNELTALGTAFANSVAAEWAPSFIAVSDGAQELIQWLGGMGEVVELVTDGAGLLSGVLAGRLVGALVASGAATVKKINADRAAAAQSAVVAQRERQVALETARRAEAEQVAAQNSARVAAQRAQAAEVEAASKLREIQTTQQLMAAERALEAQRLQAQITATGRQQSLTRLAEIRRTEQGLVAQATAQQQALHAAQQQTLISAQALATAQERAGRAATATNAAYAASTAAANAAATAHTALAGAMRLGRAAMAPLGGPLGVATLAASAFFLFRDSSDEVNASLMDLDQPLEQTIESFREMTREAQQAALVEWGRKFEDQAARSRDALGDIRQEIAKLGGASIFGGRDETQYENYRRLLGEINKVEEGSRRLADVLEEAQGYMDIPDEMFEELLLLARDYSNLNVSMDETESLMDAARASMEDAAAAAENTGQAVNNGAPSATTLDAWAKYNDRLRESIAATRDGGSAMGAANRALDGMGDDVTNIMRGYSIFLTVQDEALKDQRKAQQEAAAEARRAAEEAERNAQRQAQAAQQSAEAQAKALAGVQQEMDPLLADHAEYVERLAVLDRALAEGTISEEAYGEAVRWSAEQYQRAATGAEEYEKQTKTLISTYDRYYQKAQQLQEALEQVNQRWRNDPENAAQYARMIEGIREEMQQLALDADPAAQEMARAWEEASNRIDETFADAFAGAFDSFDDFGDQLLDGFKRLLAELAYQATLKPIVVQFTQQMGGALGIPGVGGQGGGGFNLGSIGSLKNGWDTVSGWFGGGSAAASGGLYANALTGSAAAGGLYSTAATGAVQGGLYGNALTGGLSSSAGGLSSMMAAAGPALAIYAAASAGDSLLKNVGAYDALGIRTDGRSSQFLSQFMPIGGTVIGSALDAIGIGGRKTAPKFELATVGQDVDPTQHGLFENYGEGVYSRGALGTVGFADPGTARLEETFGGFENATAFLDSITAMDNALAGVAGSEQELNAMASAVQAVRLNAGDAAGIQGQLAKRTAAAANVIDAEFTTTLVNAGATAEQITQRFVNANAAMQTLSAGADRLGIQWDSGAEGARRYADLIAYQVGGVQNLASLQESYYQQYFSDAERTAHLQDDLTASLASMGLQLPESREGFRALVEAQDLSTDAGQRNYAQLLQVAGSFDQLQSALGQAGISVNVAEQQILDLYESITGKRPDADGGAIQSYISKIDSGAITLEQALASIEKEVVPAAHAVGLVGDYFNEALREREQLERQLLQVQGDTAAIRELELDALREIPGAEIKGVVALQERIWALEDAAVAEQEAAQQQAQIAQERAGLERSLLQAQGDTAAIRELELAALDPSNRALQERIWGLEAEAQAAEEAARLQQEIAQERAGLERSLLQAQGDTAAIRELELAALDPSNRALQERIWGLEAEAQAAEEAAQIAQERAGLERSLLQAQGDTAAIRELELAALDPSNRALQERIWGLEAEAQAAEEAAQIAQERAGLERSLLQAQGDTAAIRELELAALDPSNRALQERIWSIQEETTAAEEAARLQQEIAQERAGLERALLQEQGDTAALRALELAALNPSNQALQEQIWALQDQAVAAEEATRAEEQLIQSRESAASEALRALDQAVRAERDALNTSHSEYLARISEQSSAQQEALNVAESALQSITNAANGMRLEGAQAERMRREQGISTLQSMLATGAITPGDTLNRALEAASTVSMDQYTSREDYIRDYAAAANLIADAQALAGEQVTVEERTLQSLESRAARAEAQHQAELDALTSTYQTAEQQYNALLGIDNSVLSVRDAIDGLNSALAALSDTGNNDVSANAVSVTSLLPAVGDMPTADVRVDMTLPPPLFGGGPSSGSREFNDMLDELKKLRKQVEKLEQYGFQTAKNTGQTAKYAKINDVRGLKIRDEA